jgi:hypothetical protein
MDTITIGQTWFYPIKPLLTKKKIDQINDLPSKDEW